MTMGIAEGRAARWKALLPVLVAGVAAVGAGAADLAGYGKAEDERERLALPKYRTIPAARPEELTPAGDGSDLRNGRDWTRSHGGDGGTRFSTLSQINRGNVRGLEVAWTYRSGDGVGNIQCNPVVVDGVMYVPTVGEHIAAVDGATGKELWRFKPGGQPAIRGLTFWRGDGAHTSRLLFNAGDFLWALDPKTGKPLESFGDGGKARTGHFRVAPAVHKNVIVFAGYDRDVFGYDLHTGKLLWTFHTVPHPGELGSETWDNLEAGRTVGAASRWTGSAASRTSPPARRSRTSTARDIGATTSTPIACWRWMRRPASASGTSRRSATISGTWTSPRRRCWSP